MFLCAGAHHVPWTSSRWWTDPDGYGQGAGYPRVAAPYHCERVALIPWARELLSEISLGILEEGRTTDRLIEEGTTSVLDKGMPKGH